MAKCLYKKIYGRTVRKKIYGKTVRKKEQPHNECLMRYFEIVCFYMSNFCWLQLQYIGKRKKIYIIGHLVYITKEN